MILVSSCIWQIVMVNRTEQELVILLIVLIYFLLQLGTIHWLIKSVILTLYYQVVNRKNYDTIKTIFKWTFMQHERIQAEMEVAYRVSKEIKSLAVLLLGDQVFH